MSRHILIGLTMLLLMPHALLAADDESDPGTGETAERRFEAWTKRRIKEMSAYTVSMAMNDGPVALQLEEQPLLKWSNPVRFQHRGVVFVWTDAGRPQLACSAFPYPNPSTTTHEFQSLADIPITIEPSTASPQTLDPPMLFDVLPDAPPPASSRPLRLSQMRKMAGRFGASVTHETTTDDKTRLLTQPIYRYPEDADVDGALFALSQGTDPECLVLLEATREGWQYRVCRMTAISLTVRLDNIVIKEFQPVWVEDDPSYRSLRIDAE